MDMIARERRISLVKSRTLLPAFLLLIVVFIAFINGQIKYYNLAQIAPLDAQLGGLMIFVISIAAFLLASNLFIPLKWLERFTWLFLAFPQYISFPDCSRLRKILSDPYTRKGQMPAYSGYG